MKCLTPVILSAFLIFGFGCVSTPNIPADSFLNARNLKSLEKHSLISNPSFEANSAGWEAGGGEIEIIPNKGDLLGGGRAMRLKRSDGYTRLVVSTPVGLSAGKEYTMIVVIKGASDAVPVPSPTGTGDSELQVGDPVRNFEHGRTIASRTVSSQNGRTIVPCVYIFQNDLTVEHFFLVESKLKKSTEN